MQVDMQVESSTDFADLTIEMSEPETGHLMSSNPP
jgi:hypothetical protein